MPLRIIAERVRASDLKPGDLFSTAGPAYWAIFAMKRSIGERVYIRTETPDSAAPDANEWIYRITIEKGTA